MRSLIISGIARSSPKSGCVLVCVKKDLRVEIKSDVDIVASWVGVAGEALLGS